MTLSFTIPGPPQGKQRHRTGKGHAYTPAKTKAYQSIVRACFCRDNPQFTRGPVKRPELHTGPVRLECVAYYPRPKSHYGTGRNAGKLKDTAPYYPLLKPDYDNIEKVIADSLNGLAYLDDKQVIDSHCLKLYQIPNCEPCVMVTVRLMEQQTMAEHRRRDLPCYIQGEATK